MVDDGKFSGGVRFSSKDMTGYGLMFVAWWDEFDFFTNSRFVLGCCDIVRSTVLFCFKVFKLKHLVQGAPQWEKLKNSREKNNCSANQTSKLTHSLDEVIQRDCSCNCRSIGIATWICIQYRGSRLQTWLEHLE